MRKSANILLSSIVSLLLSVFAALFIANIAYADYGISQVGAYGLGIAVFIILFTSGFYMHKIVPAGSLFTLAAINITRNAVPKNLGGMESKHYYCFVDDIDTWPDGMSPDFIAAAGFGALVTIAESDPFVMKTGKCFYEIPCTLEEGQVKSTLVGPMDSPGFENTAAFSNAGNNEPLRGYIGYTANVEQVILMKENNGTVKIIGTQGYPARLVTGEHTNGGKVSDGNIIKHSYKSCSSVPCPTYLAPIPLTPAT